VTDTDLTVQRARTSEWPGQRAVRSGVELLLGLSFFAAVAFGGYGAATGHVSVVAQVAAVVFIASLTCALVQWFSGEPGDAN
jgi:hypothetical protein